MASNETVILEPDAVWTVVLNETSDEFEERIVDTITKRMKQGN